MAQVNPTVLKAIEKLTETPITIMAPSHGIVWRRDPSRIVDLYRRWAGYANGKTENAVTLIYGSMYGNTEVMVNAVAEGLARACVPPEIFDAARTHATYIIPSRGRDWALSSAHLPTKLASFPPLVISCDTSVRKGIRNKKALRFGSYGWAGGAQRQLEKIIETARWELVDSLEFMGQPTKDDLKKGEELGEMFAQIIQRA